MTPGLLGVSHVINEVRHELATLHYYGVKNELQVETDRSSLQRTFNAQEI
jgi:hypothetical protein